MAMLINQFKHMSGGGKAEDLAGAGLGLYYIHVFQLKISLISHLINFLNCITVFQWRNEIGLVLCM